MKNKELIWRIIGMIPWVFIMVLFFIWANQDGFNIEKNIMGSLLTPITGIFWFSIVATFAEAFTEE